MSHPESPSDDHVDLDTARIIETLDRHDVVYILVGGLGAAAHANRGKDQAALPELDRLARRQKRDLDLDDDDFDIS